MEAEMSDEVLPLIAEADYPAFQEVIGELPGTYEEWHRVHAAERARRRTPDGASPTDIPISIAEFIGFREERSEQPANIRMLWLCTWEKAAQRPAMQRGHEPAADC
jgi:hypothetical protein